ncbi:MAG: S8 family serine peptidase [Acidobacteria bacterium]|nr:S8 family serine peptidase [Acidobacteriota bacterium]
MKFTRPKSRKNIISLFLIMTLVVVPVYAGILVSVGDGITILSGNGISYSGQSGLTATGADGLLAFQANGITAPVSSGLTATGADGFTFTGGNGLTATGADGLSIGQAAGLTATGADGLTITDPSGRTYTADSLIIRQPTGLTATGADGVTLTGISGLTATGADSRTISHADGLVATGADQVRITQATGLTATGADGQIFSISPNGITITGVSGLTATGADDITITGADQIITTGLNALSTLLNGVNSIFMADAVYATNADQVGITSAESLTAFATNGMTITNSSGANHQVNSVSFTHPSGLTATGADTLTASGVNGLTATGADSALINHSNGLAAAGVDGLSISTAQGLTATGADGSVISISPNGVTITGVQGLTATGADTVNIAGADTITVAGAQLLEQTGLQSLDPELATLLNKITDDSNVNAAIVYHRLPTEADIAALQQIGILGGTRYRALPVIAVTATRRQLVEVSHLPAVRSIYGIRTLPTLAVPGNGQTGVEHVPSDGDLTNSNRGLPLSGRGVTVAVLDTGLDGWHADLAGRVVNNVKLVSTLGVGVGFNYPLSLENQSNTDLVSGHGTFVAGVIAGNGSRSSGRYTGVAPGSRLLGLSAGDLNLLFVLEGFDFLAARGAQDGVRVVNCSFSANTVYDPHDPVNVATKLLAERGINVVFSAGNSGPGLHTLNPYAMAPWVISVGATDQQGRLAGFSSRGDLRTPNARPTIIAPGVNVVSLRAAGLSLTGTLGAVLGTDLSVLSLSDLPFYTVGSGTSFSAPQVVGTIALMLEANPALTPAQIRDTLQRSSTPLPPYYQHEVGAGMLNAHAAVLEAAFPQRRMGTFRASVDRGQARFINDPVYQFSGTAPALGGNSTTSLQMPQNSLHASVQISWGSLTTLNDLALRLTAPNGVARPEVNQLNLPGLTGRFERDVISMPAGGNWTVRVRNSLGLLGLTAQPYFGALEVTRAEYAQMNDLGGLSATAREEVYQNLRSFVMWPLGRNFRPQFTVSRSDLAGALVLGGRVPQYIAGQQRYSDVPDVPTRLIVESVQAASPLFPDASPGGQFRPDDRANRLTAAIALVRAAGLQAEAEAQMNASLPVSDAGSIPAQWRGYVAVALSRGLITPDGGAFRPSQALKRIELAHAMATLIRLAIE